MRRGPVGYLADVDRGNAEMRDAGREPVEAHRGGGDLLITVSGDVDLQTAPAIEDRMVDLIAAEGVGEIVLDLSKVEFFDSAGVRALVVARREAETRHRPLTVSAVSPRCRRVLEISGLDQLFGLR
jgi:anti-sigma B factor antagonist